jgi:zinc resistance-associated protein
MKKNIAAIALVLTLATVSLASARNGMGGGYGMGYNCPQMQGQMNQQLDQATQDKLDAFFRANQELHKQMMMKQSERQAMMQSANPDPAAVAKISGELFDLQANLQDKAKAAGLDIYLGGPGRGGMMGGRGMGMGCRM